MWEFPRKKEETLGNLLSWISCKVILFSQPKTEYRSPMQLEHYYEPVHTAYGEIPHSGCKVWEAKPRSRGQEGLILPRENLSLLPFWLCLSDTKAPRSLHTQQVCAFPSRSHWCKLGTKLPLKRLHSVSSFCQIMGWNLERKRKPTQIYVPVSPNHEFLFWWLTCNHRCLHPSWIANFALH